MQLQPKRPSLELSQTISKIDQLLRLYQISKKADPSKKNIVEKKVNEMVNIIKSDPLYPEIIDFLNKKIESALEDIKPSLKHQKQPSSNFSSIKSVNNLSQQKPLVSQASVSNNMSSSSQQKSKQKVQAMPSVQTLTMNQRSSSGLIQAPSVPTWMQSNQSSQMSNDKSQDNGFAIFSDNLLSICDQFAGKADELLAFNEDIFTTIKETDDDSIVYLFGINNPEKKNINTLYICTLMKFGSHEVMKILDNSGEKKFVKEVKMFENNLRTPIGLIMLGQTINDISIEHVRFLADMNSPFGVVILMESYKDRKGSVFEFSKETLTTTRELNKVEYEQKTMEMHKQYGAKGKNLNKMEVVKDKLVITKNLSRAITQSIESTQNAIQIESSNECIKQEPNHFPYKLHTKYYVSSRSDYQLFFLDNKLVAFKMNFKEKEFDLFKKFVMEEAHLKGNFLMSTSVLKETSQIKKDFWRLLVQCKSRDQYVLINLSGINNKKTIILCLNEGVTQEMIINAEPILFKDLQKSTDMINCVAVINKQNYKKFQTQSKVDVIDITPKRRL